MSLSCTGITIYDLDKKEFVYISSFNTDKIKKQKNLLHNAIKLKHIYDWIEGIKEEYPPHVVVIERGFSRYATASQVLFRVHGLINYMFWDVQQEYYPPKKIKEAIYKGNATKEQVRRVVNNNFPDLEFTNDDESDSAAIVLTFLIEENLIEFEKPIVEKKKKKGV